MSYTYSPAVSRSFSVTLLSSLPGKWEWCCKWWTPKTFAALFLHWLLQLRIQACQNICRFSRFTLTSCLEKNTIPHLKMSVQMYVLDSPSHLWKPLRVVLTSMASRPNYPAPSAEVSLPSDIGGINSSHRKFPGKSCFSQLEPHKKINRSLSRPVAWYVFIPWNMMIW